MLSPTSTRGIIMHRVIKVFIMFTIGMLLRQTGDWWLPRDYSVGTGFSFYEKFWN